MTIDMRDRPKGLTITLDGKEVADAVLGISIPMDPGEHIIVATGARPRVLPGIEPELMGLGPVHAATPILQRHGLGLNDLDLWELNEAFAAQVIGCLRAWQDDVYCRERLGLPGALGAIEPARLNIDGGAVALGHPVGASGVRIVLHLLQALRRTGGKRGIATICIGGGLGGAMLVEAL